MREREIVKELVAEILNVINYPQWCGFVLPAIDRLPDSKVLEIYKSIKEVR
jgi:hypothetical protein